MVRCPHSCLALVALLAAVATAGQASTPPPLNYTVQPLLKLGDTVGDTGLTAGRGFEVGTLGDDGRLLLVTWRSTSTSEMFFEYFDGKLRPIAFPESEGPVGKWPRGLGIFSPVSMNPSGTAVFQAQSFLNDTLTYLGTFLWDSPTGKVTPIKLQPL